MALRYSCKNSAIAIAGTTHTHLIADPNGVAVAPDEWAMNWRVGVPALSEMYMVAAPGTTSFQVATTSGSGTADIFAWYNHSSVE